MTKRSLLYCVAATGFTLAVMAIVALHAIPFGWPGVWVWEYKPLPSAERFVLCSLVAGCILALLLWTLRSSLASDASSLARRTEFRCLAALWLGCIALSATVMMMHPMGWMHPATLIINPAANSYYTTALAHPDTRELLDSYDRKMAGFTSHAQTQSAGPVVLCGALRKAYAALPFLRVVPETLFALSPGLDVDAVARQASQIWRVPLRADDAGAALFIALFSTALGACAVAPVYLLGKWLFDAPSGLCAALFFALLPSLHLFYGAVDVLYPLAVAGTLCLLLQAARSAQRPALWMALAGAWLSLWIVMNMGLITVVPLGLLFWLFLQKRAPKEVALAVAAFGGGLLVPWLLLRAGFGYDLWRVFLTSNGLRDSLYYNARPYVPSLLANLLDFFVFAGVPLSLLFAWQTARAVHVSTRGKNAAASTRQSDDVRGDDADAGAQTSPIQPSDVRKVAALLLSFLLVLAVLDLSGRVRGEAARMWMFLLPCVVVAVAPLARDLWRHNRLAFVLPLAAQTAQLMVFQFYVRVWGY